MNTFLHWILCFGIFVCPIQCFAGGLEVSFSGTDQLPAESAATGVLKYSSACQNECSSCVGDQQVSCQKDRFQPRNLISFLSIKIESAGSCGCCSGPIQSEDSSLPEPMSDAGCGCSCVCSGVVFPDSVDLPDSFSCIAWPSLVPVDSDVSFADISDNLEKVLLPYSYGKCRRFAIQSLQI